jgi:hypothetical protein
MIRKISAVLMILIVSLGFYVEGFSQSPSQYALIRRPVMKNPEIWKMTKSEAWEHLNVQLIVNSVSAAQSYVMTPWYELWSGMAFELDNGWNRMLYSECLDNWIRAYGTLGSGTGQFSWPTRLDCEAICNDSAYTAYYYLFVVDASNNRIMKLRYDWRPEDQTIDSTGIISGNGLELPQDIDINNGYEFLHTYNDYIWVLNGNSQLKRFTFNGTFKSTYGTYGHGTGQFCRPTAVVSGRSYFLSDTLEPCANTNWFYVADRGNNRLVRLYIYPSNDVVLWGNEVSLDRDIVDLEADNFGNIWAVDRSNGQLIKYTYDLFPLCTFGSSGYGENQFWRPTSFSNTGGYLGCGNAYVVESWGDSSGGQYFTIATDILDFNVYSDSSHRIHYANYILVDPADTYFRIYAESGNSIRTVKAGTRYFSGSTSLWWDGKNDAQQTVASGNYLMKVSAASAYHDISQPGNPPVDSITKEGWVCNVHPNDKAGDANSDLTVSSADIVYLVNYLFKGGPAPNPLWKGDANGDCTVNISDTVYLVAYLFKGGPPPHLNFGCSDWWKC